MSNEQVGEGGGRWGERGAETTPRERTQGWNDKVMASQEGVRFTRAHQASP